MDIEQTLQEIQKGLGDFTNATTQRLDKIESRFSKDIERIEAILARPLTGTRSYNGDGTETRNVEPLQPGEVRHLRKEDRFSDLFPQTFKDGEPARGLSFDRYVKGLITGRWDHAPLERKAMSEGDPSAGGTLVPSILSGQVIDLIRAQSAVSQLGCTTIPIPSNSLKIARITQDLTASWRAENALVSPSQPLTGEVELKPKTLAAILPVSYELLEDANDSGIFSRVLAGALAAELDRAILFGSGVGAEPLGVFNTPGINSVEMDTNGAFWDEPAASTSSFLKLYQAVQKCLESNITPSAALMSPRTAIGLAGMAALDSQPLGLAEVWNNIPKVISTQVPNDQVQGNSSSASCILLGGWQDVYVGIRHQLEVVVSKTSTITGNLGFERLQALLLCYLRADAAVVRPSSITALKGILAS